MNQNDRFARSADCPDHALLLAYQRHELNAHATEELEVHFQDCEFCLLMTELLEHHPREALTPPDPPPVPESLIKHLRRFGLRRHSE